MDVETDHWWYRRSFLPWLLSPLTLLYRIVISLRRLAFKKGWCRSEALAVPVIVVGNISVGGTGKTPLVRWLVAKLQQQGWHPGIITRGYGGKAKNWPCQVNADSNPVLVGDEPLLLARSCTCPVIAGPDRLAAGKMAIQAGVDILVSDDGLQHYALQRDMEIVVIDGQRELGNGWCLPSGPLREPPSRLTSVDCVLRNGGPQASMNLVMGAAVNVKEPQQQKKLADFQQELLFAVAGIGNPQRFFRQLEAAGLKVNTRAYPDHFSYSEATLAEWPTNCTILMTEKDAVKCLWLDAQDVLARCWYVPVEAKLSTEAEDCLLSHLRKLDHD